MEGCYLIQGCPLLKPGEMHPRQAAGPPELKYINQWKTTPPYPTRPELEKLWWNYPTGSNASGQEQGSEAIMSPATGPKPPPPPVWQSPFEQRKNEKVKFGF